MPSLKPNTARTEDDVPPDSLKHILIAGAFGGMLPPLLRVALAFTQQSSHKPDLDLFYWVGALILAALGAGTAWGFGETKRQKAILLGLSLPAFLQVAVKDIHPGVDLAKNLARHASTGFSLISSAYGADPDAVTKTDTNDLSQGTLARAVSVQLLNAESDVTAAFLDASNKSLYDGRYDVILNPKSSSQIFPIPEDAKAIRFSIGDNSSKPYPLSSQPGVAIKFQVKTNIRLQYGLLSAFGKRPTRLVDFEVTPLVIKTTITAGNVATRDEKSEKRWNWTVFIQGSDDVLNQVQYVEYTLHPTFPNPIRTVRERGTGNRAFALSSNGWGTFPIRIRVIMKNGQEQELTHILKF